MHYTLTVWRRPPVGWIPSFWHARHVGSGHTLPAGKSFLCCWTTAGSVGGLPLSKKVSRLFPNELDSRHNQKRIKTGRVSFRLRIKSIPEWREYTEIFAFTWYIAALMQFLTWTMMSIESPPLLLFYTFFLLLQGSSEEKDCWRTPQTAYGGQIPFTGEPFQALPRPYNPVYLAAAPQTES